MNEDLEVALSLLDWDTIDLAEWYGVTPEMATHWRRTQPPAELIEALAREVELMG